MTKARGSRWRWAQVQRRRSERWRTINSPISIWVLSVLVVSGIGGAYKLISSDATETERRRLLLSPLIIEYNNRVARLSELDYLTPNKSHTIDNIGQSELDVLNGDNTYTPKIGNFKGIYWLDLAFQIDRLSYINNNELLSTYSIDPVAVDPRFIPTNVHNALPEMRHFGFSRSQLFDYGALPLSRWPINKNDYYLKMVGIDAVSLKKRIDEELAKSNRQLEEDIKRLRTDASNAGKPNITTKATASR
jgi:hypothetical protein